jgi:hypothetical protein
VRVTENSKYPTWRLWAASARAALSADGERRAVTAGLVRPADQVQGVALVTGPAVHNHVDDLCANTLNLCMPGGNAGDKAVCSHLRMALPPGESPSAACVLKKTGIVHMPCRGS